MIGAMKYLDRKKPQKVNKKNFAGLPVQHKTGKNNNNSNINGPFKLHTERISFPPDFVSRQIAFPKLTSDSHNSGEERETEIDVFTPEGLCCDKSSSGTNNDKIRRSDRLKKAAGNRGNAYPLNGNPKKTDAAIYNIGFNCRRRKSKSIFQEINEKYENHLRKVSQQKKTNQQEGTCKPPVNLTNFFDNFTKKFASELKIKFKNDPLEYYIENVLQFAKNLNMDSNKSSKEEEMQEEVERKKKFCEKLQLIPKNKWVYQTPPKQRIASAKLAESTIKPAVICSINENRNQLYSINTPDISFDTNLDSLNAEAFQHEATFGEMTSNLLATQSVVVEAPAFLKSKFIPLGNKRKFSILQPITEEKTTQTETKESDLEDGSTGFNPIIEQPTRTKRRCNKRIEHYYKCKKHENLFNNLPSCSKLAAESGLDFTIISSPSNSSPLREKNHILMKRNILQEITTNEKRLNRQRDEGNTSMFFNFSKNK